jgi:hypothetical protein
VQTSKQTMHGVKVTPARCAQATVTGFNSASFTHAPASVVTFRIGRDGVSEVLVSATPDVAHSAAGYSQVNVWSVVYRADGFVGALTIVGPDASQASAKKLASQAYAYARQSLS